METGSWFRYNFYSFKNMKKFILSGILGLLTLGSCTKENLPKDLVGDWVNTNRDYVVVLNTDCDFVNVYTLPWSGTIKIDNQFVEVPNIQFGVENVFGQRLFYGQSIGIKFDLNSFNIQYNGHTYNFSDSYSLDLKSGIFKADGIASDKNGQISVYVDLVALKSKLSRNVEYTISDSRYTGGYPISQFSFESDGGFFGLLTGGDVISTFNGRWRKNSEKIMVWANYTSSSGFNEEYKFSLNDNRTLTLIKENVPDRFELYTGIPASKVVSAKYRTTFVRE